MRQRCDPEHQKACWLSAMLVKLSVPDDLEGLSSGDWTPPELLLHEVVNGTWEFIFLTSSQEPLMLPVAR